MFFGKKETQVNNLELAQELVKIVFDIDNSLRKDLLQKVFVSGGNSSLRGFKDCLELNISQVQTLNSKIKVH